MQAPLPLKENGINKTTNMYEIVLKIPLMKILYESKQPDISDELLRNRNDQCLANLQVARAAECIFVCFKNCIPAR